MFRIMLSMWSEVVAFIISFCSRALRSFPKCKFVMVSSIGRISCPEFRMCSEKVDFPFDVEKSFLCSLNLFLKFLFVRPM